MTERNGSQLHQYNYTVDVGILPPNSPDQPWGPKTTSWTNNGGSRYVRISTQATPVLSNGNTWQTSINAGGSGGPGCDEVITGQVSARHTGPLSDITVELYEDGSETLIDTTVTVHDGIFLFGEDIDPNTSYRLKFIDSSGGHITEWHVDTPVHATATPVPVTSNEAIVIDAVLLPNIGHAGYSDVTHGTWADPAIDWAAHMGISTGYPDNTFKPNTNVNRSQLAMWLWHTMDDPAGSPQHSFTDVVPNPGNWAEDGINWASHEGIIVGYNNGTLYQPTDNALRRQVITWLYKMAGSPDVSTLPAHGLTDVDPWYTDAVQWAVANNIATGYSDNTFRGANTITRAQATNWLYGLATEETAWDPSVTPPSTVLF